MEFDEQARADIAEYQAIQQQLQMVMMQKQQFQMQISEGKKAEEQLQNYTGTVFRFAGGILIEKKPDKLTEELKNERETLEIRSNTIEKQESKLIERLKMLEGKLAKLQAGSSMGGSSGEGASVGSSGNSSGPSVTRKSKGAA